MEDSKNTFLRLAKESGFTDDEVKTFLDSQSQNPVSTTGGKYYDPPAETINPVPITQSYGQRSGFDVFSHGINTGVDYATNEGTPVNLPKGNWEVEDAYNQALGKGYIGNNTNQGYGNSVKVKNKDTGEQLRLSHLSQVNPDLTKGFAFLGGNIGRTGMTGNVTGPHLDAEFYDNNGNMGDILGSSYGNIIPHNSIPPQSGINTGPKTFDKAGFSQAAKAAGYSDDEISKVANQKAGM